MYRIVSRHRKKQAHFEIWQEKILMWQPHKVFCEFLAAFDLKGGDHK
jgi:hypothetical protein